MAIAVCILLLMILLAIPKGGTVLSTALWWFAGISFWLLWLLVTVILVLR